MVRRLFILVAAALFCLPLTADEIKGSQFAIAIEDGDSEAIKQLLDDGAAADTWIEYGEHKITPLMKASWDGENAIVEILLASGAKVNATASDDGGTALMNAVTRGHIEVIRTLLKAGADVSPKNTYGFNVFTSAVAAGNQEVAGMLLEAGAKVNEGAHMLTPLQFAASSGNVDMIRFLAAHGADVNYGAKKGEQTALLSAIYGAHAEVVKALIELKASVNTKTKDGDTPLSVARKGDQEDIIAILKAAGAKK